MYEGKWLIPDAENIDHITASFHKELPCPGISQHVLFLMAAGNARGDIFSKSGILSILKQRLLTPTLRSILARLDINYKQSVNRYLLCYYVIYFVFKGQVVLFYFLCLSACLLKRQKNVSSFETGELVWKLYCVFYFFVYFL